MWIDFAGQFQKSLTALPLKTYQAGETVLANGSRTNELLILRNGSVAVVKEGIELCCAKDLCLRALFFVILRPQIDAKTLHTSRGRTLHRVRHVAALRQR
jgi:hypothetical protein